MSNLSLILIKFAGLIDGSGIRLPNQNLPDDNSGIQSIFQNVLSVVFGALGVICILIITIAGLQYVLSGGDPQKTAKAKNTILYAVIGLVVAISAFTIVNFVFKKAEI